MIKQIRLIFDENSMIDRAISEYLTNQKKIKRKIGNNYHSIIKGMLIDAILTQDDNFRNSLLVNMYELMAKAGGINEL